jgi:hypothetical protein
VEELCEED